MSNLSQNASKPSIKESKSNILEAPSDAPPKEDSSNYEQDDFSSPGQLPSKASDPKLETDK